MPNEIENEGYDLELYDGVGYGEVFIRYRWMPQASFDEYYSLATRALKRPPTNILDIGCGTGQFAIRIAEKLLAIGETYAIDALDGSAHQLELLSQIVQDEGLIGIQTHNIDFASFTALKKYDLIICSEMIHTISDLEGFAGKISEMLSDDGIVCIRTSSPEQLSTRSTYCYFPKCRYMDLFRNKSKQLISAAFALSGNHHMTEHDVDESRYFARDHVLGLFKNRAFSTLHYLSDAEFTDGINKMEKDYQDQDEVLLDFNMTLYIVAKGKV